MPTFKSYCWSLGTTSFRTKEFNFVIEKQLALLDEFWKRAENYDQNWNGNSNLQINYYNFLHEHKFLHGSANNKAKDAREKTSGLVDLGLIFENRKITQVGRKLIELSRKNEFPKNNILEIAADSFIYLKQLLKTSVRVGDAEVRPFCVLIDILLRLNFLTKEEFEFLLPLIVSQENLEEICTKIEKLRRGEDSIDEIISNVLSEMQNYQEAIEMFLMAPVVDEDLICEIGMNRKSRNYDRVYFQFFKDLFSVSKSPTVSNILNLKKSCDKLRLKSLFFKILFKDTKIQVIRRCGAMVLKDVKILKSLNEQDFRKEFFKMLHLVKAKANLQDYFDLNRRYLKLSDIIIFDNEKIELTLSAKALFQNSQEIFNQLSFKSSENLTNDVSISKILPDFSMMEHNWLVNLQNILGENNINSSNEAQIILHIRKQEQFNKLIDRKFSKRTLLNLLDLFEERKDDEIQKIVTDNADAPTIFEYIVGIIWYELSGRKGDILNYMKLSLDSELLPKTHAAGGSADIVYEYEKCEDFPKHTLLIELTLSDRNSQRRMEMEPVSRHLGERLLENKTVPASAVFITTFLNTNVLSDFRSRKNILYYSANGDLFVEGMQIIPIETKNLKEIIIKGKNYASLYKIFKQAYEDNILSNPRAWWKQNIVEKI